VGNGVGRFGIVIVIAIAIAIAIAIVIAIRVLEVDSAHRSENGFFLVLFLVLLLALALALTLTLTLTLVNASSKGLLVLLDLPAVSSEAIYFLQAAGPSSLPAVLGGGAAGGELAVEVDLEEVPVPKENPPQGVEGLKERDQGDGD